MKIKLSNVLSITCLLGCAHFPVQADPVKHPQNPQESMSSQTQAEKELEAIKKNSVEDALKWLHLIDETKYAESWDKASLTLRLKIPKNYWITLMENIRKPMGSLISRKLLDQRTAKNPVGLPKGDYMVLVFQASFSRKEDAKELVTLVQESDGNWRVLTYQVQ